MLKKTTLISLTAISVFSSSYSKIFATENDIKTAINTNLNAVELLPAQYQELVSSNLKLSGTNAENLLSAILEINPEYREGLGFLLAYMSENDLKNLSKDFLIENVSLAYKVKENSPWAQNLSKEMFFNYILPYANVNESRDNWRADFYERFYKAALNAGNTESIVKKFNELVFNTFNVRYHAYLREKPHQSPYESIKIGYASCTGLSILLADALRAVGVPARLAGIVSWPQTGGNHTWVEVWDNGWYYIGAAEPGEYDQTWFTDKARLANPQDPNQSIYAVSYKKTSDYFPMVWDYYNQTVSAENVTQRYIK